MYELTHYAFCESIESTADGKQRIIGPLAAIPLISVPGQFSFSFSFGIINANINETNKVRISITGPDGKNIMDTEGTLDPSQDNPTPVGALSIGLDIRNLLFHTTGVHEVVIEFNGELVHTINLRVSKTDGPIDNKGE